MSCYARKRKDKAKGTHTMRKNLLNDLDKLPKQTTKTKAEGYRGETRSINIPATKTMSNMLEDKTSKCRKTKNTIMDLIIHITEGDDTLREILLVQTAKTRHYLCQ